jgi:phenylacetate-coenzyme A ligase PaaK-like adenylate-forming protein
MTIDDLFAQAPFSMPKEQKAMVLTEQLRALTAHHVQHCEPYRKILVAMGLQAAYIQTLADVPFLPTRMFKAMELRSVDLQDVVKTMTSSGTSGQAVSRIFLDRDTSAQQTKVLTRIVSDFVGKKRLPLVILDTSEVVKNRQLFSARGAGILGFSMFGSKKIYALNEHMEIDVEAMSAFLAEHAGQRIMLFGFTFMVWLHFVQTLERTGFRPDLSKAVLIHGGGFKKLADQAVSKEEFKERLKKVCGIAPENVHDYYGMVEQTGTIYVECTQGHLHASNFSDVIIRRAEDFSVASVGEKGIVQVLSVLPRSYPGHSLLTEDEGLCLGEDDCPCGRFGKYFRIEGRLRRAEIRGCSDTYASSL